jgi:DNA-binding beta-propeller fold protein YncE
VDAPVGITSSADGKQVVIGQMGEINVPNDSLLCFYNAEDGKLISSHNTSLHDIVGLAYSPKTGKLYAVDFAWMDTAKGGLFELRIKDGEVHSRFVAGLDKPTALAFDAAGNLFVTAIGTPKEGSQDPAGMVVVFPAGL